MRRAAAVVLSTWLIHFAVVAAASGQAADVRITRPEHRSMSRALRITGEVKPRHEAEIAARVSGFVASVTVDAGDRVEEGATLLVLDAPVLVRRREAADAELARAGAAVARSREVRTIAEARIREADADLAVARARAGAETAKVRAADTTLSLRRVTFERLRGLRDRQAATPQEVDEAEAAFRGAEADAALAAAAELTARAEVEAAAARVDVARADLGAAGADVTFAEAGEAAARARRAEAAERESWLAVKAPWTGRIQTRRVHPGAFVRGGEDGLPTALFTVHSEGPVRIVFEVPDADAGRVRPGDPVRVSGRGLGGEPIAGAVSRISPARNPGTRAAIVEVDLEDPRLAAGMFITVDLRIETRGGALTVPLRAVRRDARGAAVLVVRGGRVESVAVVTGLEDAERVEILSGLTTEDDVIAGDATGLKAGMIVNAVRADTGPSPGATGQGR